MAKIQDYAVIGNCRSAALISKEGSLDWLCWPVFNSPSLFAQILDDEKGGYWKISPVNSSKIERQYIENTNVLMTKFYTASGQLALTDFMPVCSEKEKKSYNIPEHEILRYIECLEGKVDVECKFYPRPNYGLKLPRLKSKGKLGIYIESDSLFVLQTSLNLPLDDTGISYSFQLVKNEHAVFSLTCHTGEPAVLAIPDKIHCQEKLQRTIGWWKDWSCKLHLPGLYHSQIIRSALALKLLSFAPTGAFIAAPTTSLPEKVGGKLNWDYRFVWLRDCSFVTRSLYYLKRSDEAHPFVNWMLYFTVLSESLAYVYFDVYGRQFTERKILSHFKGYLNSQPVRVGNLANKQFQLDILGEIVEAITLYFENHGQIDRLVKKFLLQIGRFVVLHWNEPDNGIWESRDERNRFTYSALMCWWALTKILQYKDILEIKPEWTRKFESTRQTIRKEIEEKAWNENLKTYTDVLNGNEVSVSLLSMARTGFEKPESARMQLTFNRIKEKLHIEQTLFYRNEESKKRGDGSFNTCSFWIVEYLANGGGTLEETKKAFDEALSYGNDIGLFSEETEIKSHEALGNFPQAISHSSLINAALSIASRERKENP